MNTKTILAKNLKAFMQSRGYNIAKLSRETKIARSTIHSVLNKKTQRIDIENLESICATLEIPVYFLFQNYEI